MKHDPPHVHGTATTAASQTPRRQQCLFTCSDPLCQMLDRIGVPEDQRWRALIVYMRSLSTFDNLSAVQKSHIQTEVLDTLKQRDFSELRFRELVGRVGEIINEPYRRRLQEILAETARTLSDVQEMLLKRRGDVQQLETDSVELVVSEREPEQLVAKLRVLFTEVLESMDQDAEQLMRISRTDSLTDLANRRAFDETLEQRVAAARASGQALSLLMLDIDHFKQFNDHFGHLVGDQALITVARILKGCLPEPEGTEETSPAACRLDPDAPPRPADILAARYGGEEFMLLVPDRSLPDAVQLAEHIREQVESHRFVVRDAVGAVRERGIKLTVSLGVAELALGMTLPEDLVAAADRALYAAKHRGRNRVEQA